MTNLEIAMFWVIAILAMMVWFLFKELTDEMTIAEQLAEMIDKGRENAELSIANEK